jgi:BON domain
MKIAKLCLPALALLVAVPLLAQAPVAPGERAPSGAAANVAANGAVNQPDNDAASAAQTDAIPAMPADETARASASQQQRLVLQVRHALVMLPSYGMWDWLAFRVNGRTVELLGDAYSEGLKDAAVSAVGQIDGVGRVINHIQRLNSSPEDDRIRRQVASAIYEYGSLSRYAWSAARPIHILVKDGRVRLEGLVDTQADKDAAAHSAQGVSGVLQVTNHLRVGQQ